MKRETVITGRRLALGPRKRVFLAGLRVQEHRKVLADLLVAEVSSISSGVAPTTHQSRSFDRTSQLFIPNSATDEVHLHRAILANETPVTPLVKFTPSQTRNRLAGLCRTDRLLLRAGDPWANGGAGKARTHRSVAGESGDAGRHQRETRARPASARSSRSTTGPAGQQELPSYSDLERDYVVWNVFAAPEFSLQRRSGATRSSAASAIAATSPKRPLTGRLKSWPARVSTLR